MKIPNTMFLQYLLFFVWAFCFIGIGFLVIRGNQRVITKSLILVVSPLIVLPAIPLVLGNVIRSEWMRATPDSISDEQKEEIDTAIIFGFGYENDGFKLAEQALKNLEDNGIPADILRALGELKGQPFASKKCFLEAIERTIGKENKTKYQKQLLKHAENMMAGNANKFLLEEIAIQYLQVTTIIVQEGIWIAGCERDSSEPCTISGPKGDIKIYRMHHHDPENYVNTFEAAFCAMEKMEELKKNKAFIIAHDLQLQRAVWDVEVVRQHNLRKEWKDFTFVIPTIPDTPYPALFKSAHHQTRHEFIYKPVELLYSRPRDLRDSRDLILTQCKAPVKEYEKEEDKEEK